jgi:hypothetical protein
MKLPIKKEFFDAIKKGYKTVEWRDAHITFVCDETGETLTKKVKAVYLTDIWDLPEVLHNSEYRHLFTDNDLIRFELG